MLLMWRDTCKPAAEVVLVAVETVAEVLVAATSLAALARSSN